MRHLTIVLVVALGLLMPVLAEDPVVRLVEFEYAITPLSALRITQAIADAESAGDAFVLIELDTPGGLVFSMEDIVKAMLGAKVPIVVWVGPAGAQAASAGFFLLIAADVATMAPGTRTGAASTVYLGESKDDDIHLKKSNEDLAALIRSIADRRGRNPQICQEAVLSAKAWEETIALEEGLVDLIVSNRQELLERLDGREIKRFDGSIETLHTANATFVSSTFDLKHRFMEFLATPAIAVLLLLGGLFGIYIEFTHPGVVFPGVMGALCLILFGMMAQVLPVSLTGVLLIALGIVMFILEIKVVSFGMLTLGGSVCLVGGSLMLIDGPIPELRVPWGSILPTSIAIAALFALIVRLVIKARAAQVSTGTEGLVGKVGNVVVTLDPQGKVFIHGELWNATTEHGQIPEGAQVKVTRVDELMLTVEPTSD